MFARILLGAAHADGRYEGREEDRASSDANVDPESRTHARNTEERSKRGRVVHGERRAVHGNPEESTLTNLVVPHLETEGVT